MKHIFIMNPAAGKGKAEKVFLPKIIETSKKMEIDYEIHRTMRRGEAENFVKNRCETLKTGLDKGEEHLRFYACGGDGTLNEVVNGAFGYNNVEIAMIPAGTGNDFPRNFGSRKHFENIKKQINGQARDIDLISYEDAEDSDKTSTRYCINMFNVGLDCNVVAKAAEIKTNPFVPGPLAYIFSALIILGKKECVELKIEFEDGQIQDKEIMLIAIGNGCFCGGGFKGVPKASLEDGQFDVSIVENISRKRFLTLLGKYKKGTHLEDPYINTILSYRKCKNLTVKPKSTMRLCTDGEIKETGATKFQIVSKCIKFSVPQGCE